MNNLERFLNWCRKPIKTPSTRFKTFILPTSVSILCILTFLVLCLIPNIFALSHPRLEINEAVFNEDSEGNPISVTMSIENLEKIEATITSLIINETVCIDTEPKFPIPLKAEESVEIVVPYKWHPEGYYFIGIEYEARGGNYNTSAYTWTKPIVKMRVLRERNTILVSRNVEFNLIVEYMKGSLGHSRRWVTNFVELQSPRGILERVEISHGRNWGVNCGGRYNWDHIFNEAGNWTLKFQSKSETYGILAEFLMEIEVLDSGFSLNINSPNREYRLEETIPSLWKFMWEFRSPIHFYEDSEITAYGINIIEFNIEVDWRKISLLSGELIVEVVDPSLTKTIYQIKSIEVIGSGSTGLIEWYFNVTKPGPWLFEFKLALGDMVRHKTIGINVERTSLFIDTATTKKHYNIGEIIDLYIKKTEINVVRKEPYNIRYLIETKSPLGLNSSRMVNEDRSDESGFSLIKKSIGTCGFPYAIALIPGVYDVTVKLLSDGKIIAIATTKFVVKGTPSIQLILIVLIIATFSAYFLKNKIQSIYRKSRSRETAMSKLGRE